MTNDTNTPKKRGRPFGSKDSYKRPSKKVYGERKHFYFRTSEDMAELLEEAKKLGWTPARLIDHILMKRVSTSKNVDGTFTHSLKLPTKELAQVTNDQRAVQGGY